MGIINLIKIGFLVLGIFVVSNIVLGQTDQTNKPIKKILLTYFGPYYQYTENGSEVVAKLMEKLNKENPESKLEIKICGLPVSYSRSVIYAMDCLAEQGMDQDYDLILGLGHSGVNNNKCNLKLESTLYNLNHFNGPDVDGVRMVAQKVIANAPRFIFSTYYPSDDILKSKNDRKLVTYSKDPGNFVCNHYGFSMLNFLQKNQSKTKFGFIHVPEVKPIGPTKITNPSKCTNHQEIAQTILNLLNETL